MFREDKLEVFNKKKNEYNRPRVYIVHIFFRSVVLSSVSFVFMKCVMTSISFIFCLSSQMNWDFDSYCFSL